MNIKTNFKIPICPTCGADLEIIYPDKDDKVCKFECGHILWKTKKYGFFEVRKSRKEVQER